MAFTLLLILSCSEDKTQSEDTTQERPTEKTEVTEPTEEKIEGPFAIKSGVITYHDKKLDGTVTATKTFYFDNYGNTLKLEETIDGETSIYIFDNLLGKGQTSFPGRKPSKMRMRQGELNSLVAKHSTSGYAKQDNETIIGKECIVYANNAKSAEGESKHIYWKHKGILLKEVSRLGGGYITEAVSFEEKALDKSLFPELE